MFGTAQLTDDAVAAAAGGSAREVSRVLDMVQPQVRLMVTARLSPAPHQLHAVEELAQATLAALSEGLARLRSPTVAGLRAYMSGIASRKVADFLNERGGGGAPGRAPVSLDAMNGTGAALWQVLSASGASPRTSAERAELIGRVMACLGRLAEDHRRVITLAFFDQMTTAQIARRLEITRPAASMLLLRALRALRRETAV